MSNTDPAMPGQRPLLQEMWNALRYYLGTRTGLVLSAIVILGAAAYFNWGWLIAAGLAPIIIAVLPCAAMCALGLCMGGHSKSSGKDAGQSNDGTAAMTGNEPLKLSASAAETATKKNAKKGHNCC